MPKTKEKNSAPPMFPVLIICVLLLFALYGNVIAANIGIPQNFSSFSIKSSPETPGPFENVLISIESYNADLDRSEISWFVNGKNVKTGVGETKLSITTGDIGETMKIDTIVKTANLETLAGNIFITPAEVDVLWEAIDSYTPPFYKGKALPSSQSAIRAVAVPNIIDKNGNQINPSDAVYYWKKNYKYRDLKNQSGYGKQAVDFTGDILRANELVEVEVSSIGGNSSAKGNAIIKRIYPSVVFYTKHPLDGILYENAIQKSFSLKDTEVEVIAEPYFFSLADKNFSNIKFNWKINGKDAGEDGGNRNIVFRNGNNKNGKAEIFFSARGISKILQFAQGAFDIEF